MLGSMTNYRTFLRRFYYEPVHSLPSSQPLPHVGNSLAGIGAGWTVSFVAAPVEHVKARLQVQYHDARQKHTHPMPSSSLSASPSPHLRPPQQPFFPGPISCTKHILTQHGLRGLYHGLLSTLLFRSHFCVMWYSYSRLTSLFKSHTTLSDPAINFWAGGLGAQMFWLTSYPFDVVKQRIMTDRIVSSTTSTPSQSIIGRIVTGASGYAGGAKYGTSWLRAARGVYEEGGVGWRGFWRGFLPCFLRAFPANAMALVTFEGVMRVLP